MKYYGIKSFFLTITYVVKFMKKMKFVLESKKIENLKDKHFKIIYDLSYIHKS